LAHIFDLSFTTGEVPELLKIAEIIPVYKKGKEINPEIIAVYICRVFLIKLYKNDV